MSLQLLPTALSELFVQVMTTRKITLADRYGIQAALCDETLSEEEVHVINRLLYALRKGQIQVVDELSTLL